MNNDTYTERRLPAEWEKQGAVIVAWPHKNTDWAYMLEQAQQCYINIIEAITRHAIAIVIAPDTKEVRSRLQHIDTDKILYLDVPTTDTWVRDYGVLTARDEDDNPVLCDFGFNAWGGKFESALDNGVNRFMYDAGLIKGKYEDHNDFILEGGSIESDGNGTILTTTSCLLTPTRNHRLNKSDIEKTLEQTLGARKVLWLDCDGMIGDDTDGHIDTIARLAPDNCILFNRGNSNDDDPQSQMLAGIENQLRAMTDADGRPFNLIELPLPEAIMDEDDGHRLPATYANFLIINDAVIMPVYGQPLNDERAEMTLKVVFPDHVIEKVDCTALIRQHGSLHCATMQVPADILPI